MCCGSKSNSIRSVIYATNKAVEPVEPEEEEEPEPEPEEGE